MTGLGKALMCAAAGCAIGAVVCIAQLNHRASADDYPAKELALEGCEIMRPVTGESCARERSALDDAVSGPEHAAAWAMGAGVLGGAAPFALLIGAIFYVGGRIERAVA